MANYYLTTEAHAANRRQLLLRALFTGAILNIGGFCYCYFILKGDLYTSLGLTAIFLPVSIFNYYRNTRQQKAVLDSYRLEVEPMHITRFQQGLPTLQLLPQEITSITQSHSGALTINTSDKYRAIYIPFQLTSREALVQELASFIPITISTQKTLAERLTPYAGFLMLVLMGTFYSVSNKIISTVTGTIILVILGWSGWHIWRNPNLAPQAKRLRWFLPVVFLSILAMAIARLQQ